MDGFTKLFVVVGSVLYIGLLVVMMVFGSGYFLAELVMILIGYGLHRKRAHLKRVSFWTNWICGSALGLCCLVLGPGVVVAGPLVRFGFVYYF